MNGVANGSGDEGEKIEHLPPYRGVLARVGRCGGDGAAAAATAGVPAAAATPADANAGKVIHRHGVLAIRLEVSDLLVVSPAGARAGLRRHLGVQEDRAVTLRRQ